MDGVTSQDRGPDRNSGSLRVALSVDEFMTFLHSHDLLHLGVIIEGFQGMVASFITDGANDDMFHTPNHMRLIPQLFNFVEDLVFFFS